MNIFWKNISRNKKKVRISQITFKVKLKYFSRNEKIPKLLNFFVPKFSILGILLVSRFENDFYSANGIQYRNDCATCTFL